MIIIFIRNGHRLLVIGHSMFNGSEYFWKFFFFIGLNAPLYARHNEQGILSTLNINATVMYWQTHGLDKNKIIIGLPTYGHSFR